MKKHQEALGEMPIKKLLFKMATPAIIGMLANSLYNLVDTIFIGQGVGTLAIAGLTVSFPMQMLVLAISFLIGMGAAAMISKRLGEKNFELAYLAAGNSMFAVLIVSVTIAILGYIFIEPLLIAFGATETIIPYAKDYLSIVLIGNPFFAFAVTANSIIRAEGNAKTAMFSMLLALGLNIILDPIFIFGLDMGIRGAALATVIAQVAGFIYVFHYFAAKKTSLKLQPHHFKISKKIMKEIIALGSSSFFRQVTFIILAIVIQNALKVYGGDIYIAVYGIINRTQMFVMMPLFGFAQAYQPIIGFNYGAKKYDRVLETHKQTMKYTTIYSTVFWLFMMFFASQIISVFTTNQEVIMVGAFALRLNVLMFFLFGTQMVGATYFMAVGKAGIALFLTLSRQLLILIPLVIILPFFFQVNGIWYAFPIADAASIILVYILLKKELKLLAK